MKGWKRLGYILLGILLTAGLVLARPMANSVSSQTLDPKPDLDEMLDNNSDFFPGDFSFDGIVQNSESSPGLFTIYRNPDDGSSYLKLRPDQLRTNYLCVMTLSSGLGDIFYQGWSLGDFVFQFQQVNDTIQLVVPNLYFRTDADDPQRRSIERSFSDSAIASMPIVDTSSDDGAMLIDVNQMLVYGSDLSRLSSIMTWIFGGSVFLQPETSHLTEAEAFPGNVELDVSYNFSGDGIFTYLPSLPDDRAFTIDVHYSFSELPTNNGYQPRLADERVGYFISAYQDLSSFNQRDNFVRNITRWHLEKQHPELAVSPPTEPIVFWIENTVPFEYRDAVRDGVLQWNEAFETAGFEDAIEVRQMPDDAEWDPADVRYNVIRWSNSLYSFALGIAFPRINPLTGQILNADVVLDANLIRYVRNTEGFLAQQQQAFERGTSVMPSPQLCDPNVGEPYLRWISQQATRQQPDDTNAIAERWQQRLNQTILSDDTCFGMGMAYQGAMASLSLATLQNVLPSGDEMDTFIHQFVAHLTAHEVGHTLGLRHNFRASMMLEPEELNDLSITRDRGLAGSVMDYTAVNLAPVGTEQGDYYSVKVGPYDKWAIAYGYTPTASTLPIEESRELEAIARRSPEPDLAYATDQDAFDLVNTSASFWDLSGNPLQYAQQQLDLAQTLWEKLPNRYPLPGESYSELRDRFDMVLSHYFSQVFQMTRYVGGQVFNRDRRGDPGARQPFEAIPLAQQQEALQAINDYVFAADAFSFSPDFLSQLAPSRWFHWGASSPVFRLDYPAYDTILWMQGLTLSDLLSSERLNRIRDAELSYAPGETLALPELFGTLHEDIWTEVMEPSDDDASISSIRRGLQRQHLNILSNMALRNTDAISDATNFMDFIVALFTLDAPEDARVLARYQLRQLDEEIGRALRRHDDDMDTITIAYLEDTQDRIAKVIDAPLRGR
ncbi:MAG: zinc-dependent metalloprotease [Cyanobacteria bacterium P01_E01_bin.6]